MLFILTSFLTLSLGIHPNNPSDSLRGHLITTVTTRGQFVSFDKNHATRFFLRDASNQMVMNCIMTEPGTDLFLASHAKDDLKLTYQVREVTAVDGTTERLKYAMSIRSLRTGDDAREWAGKIANDSILFQNCKKLVSELRDEK
jgi:hypothetical protein